MNHEDLKGKVALITGASSGIGRSISHKLGKLGLKLVLASRNKSNLEELSFELKEDHGIESLILPTDVTKEDEVERLIEKTIEKFRRIDVLINNAGIIRYGELENFSSEDYKDMMRTNCDGMFYTTRTAIPFLKESKGNLIYIGSFDSNYPRSFNPIYAATKWWTKGFAHSVESILGEEGVGVTLINPSEVRTKIKDEDGKTYKEKYQKEEVLEPEEIGEAVVFVLKQKDHTTISELNIYRKDKLSDFF